MLRVSKELDLSILVGIHSQKTFLTMGLLESLFARSQKKGRQFLIQLTVKKRPNVGVILSKVTSLLKMWAAQSFPLVLLSLIAWIKQTQRILGCSINHILIQCFRLKII